jgi:hypothetical protein
MSHSETLGLGLQHEFGALWNLGVVGGARLLFLLLSVKTLMWGKGFLRGDGRTEKVRG